MLVERIVVDTNVFVSAILSGNGASRAVIRLCFSGETIPVFGNALFLEYEDVIARSALFDGIDFSLQDRNDLFDALLSVSDWIDVKFLWRPNLRDEADNHVLELAIAANAVAVITGNTRDFQSGDLKFEHVSVLTPAQYLERNR